MPNGVFCPGLVPPWAGATLCRWLGRQREPWPWVQFACPRTCWPHSLIRPSGRGLVSVRRLSRLIVKGEDFGILETRLTPKLCCFHGCKLWQTPDLTLGALIYKMRRLTSNLTRPLWGFNEIMCVIGLVWCQTLNTSTHYLLTIYSVSGTGLSSVRVSPR